MADEKPRTAAEPWRGRHPSGGSGPLVLVEVKVTEKCNEIVAIPKLLDRLDLEGAVIAMDVMGCRRAARYGPRPDAKDPSGASLNAVFRNLIRNNLLTEIHASRGYVGLVWRQDDGGS